MGTIRYKIAARVNKLDGSDDIIYGPVKMTTGGGASRVTTEDLFDYIVQNAQIPRSVLPAAFSAIRKSIMNFVMNGHSIRIEGLGSFTPLLKMKKGVQRIHASEVVADDIEAIRLRFTPSVKIKNRIRYETDYQILNTD